VVILSKKNPLPPSGLVTDFVLPGFWVRLGHYRPLIIIADDDTDDDDNKANEVDNGDSMNHATLNYFFLPVTLTAGRGDVKRFSRSSRVPRSPLTRI
jgi:hypothetical protein